MLEVRGLEQLEALADRLHAAGSGGGLAREVQAALEESVRPLPGALRGSASSTLPRRGGLAGRVATRSQVRVTGQQGLGRVGVSVEVDGPYDLARLDDGTVRHRVFGRGRSVTQKIRPGWLSRPVEEVFADAPAVVEAAAVRVVEQVINGK